jgi:uncharacterized protein YukE
MTVPASYDAVTMTVNPGLLQMSGDMIQDAAEDIVTALNTIDNTLSNLQLGWAGQTAQEAEDFGDQWMAAMTGLFGNANNPKSGVMDQVIVALLTAAGNFSNAEDAVISMFGQLAMGIVNGSSGSSGSDTDPILAPTGTAAQPDGNLSAVGEIGWTSIPS